MLVAVICFESLESWVVCSYCKMSVCCVFFVESEVDSAVHMISHL